jgi:hypothetical protein
MCPHHLDILWDVGCAWLWDSAQRVCGVPARVFGGGGHTFRCRYRLWQQQEWQQQQQRCCHHLWCVPFPCVHVSLVGGGGGRCLPGSCLAAASTSPSSLFSSFPSLFPSPSPSFPSPSFVHKLSRSLTQLSFSCEVGGCGGLVVPMVTSWLHGGGDATPTRVASWDVLTVVGVGEVGAVCGEVVIRFNTV